MVSALIWLPHHQHELFVEDGTELCRCTAGVHSLLRMALSSADALLECQVITALQSKAPSGQQVRGLLLLLPLPPLPLLAPRAEQVWLWQLAAWISCWQREKV